MREIADPRTRNATLFSWIDQHRDEFGQECRLLEPPEDPSTAWCSLERLPYEWILEDATPEEAWRAMTGLQDLEMSKRVAVGYHHPVDVDIPRELNSPFASSEGRDLLNRRALDISIPVAHRYLALLQLRDHRTLIPESSTRYDSSAWTRIDEFQLLELQTTTTEILDEQNPQLDSAAFGLLRALCLGKVPQQVLDDPKWCSDLVVDRYESQPPGWQRNHYARWLNTLLDDYQWQQLTGNPDKALIQIESHQLPEDANDQRVFFELSFRPTEIGEDLAEIYIVAERLDELGEVIELQQLRPTRTHRSEMHAALGMSSTAPWFHAPTDGLSEGIWRLTVHGVVGPDDSRSWTSEPALVDLVPN